MKIKNYVILICLAAVYACDQKDVKQEKLYVELKKDYEYYKKAQNQMDTNLKKTEEELLKVKENLKNELGYFSTEYHQFDEDLKKYISILEDQAISHQEVLYEQSVLEDEIANKRMKYEEAVKKKEIIEKKRAEVEKNFQISLTSQDTLFIKADKLIHKNS